MSPYGISSQTVALEHKELRALQVWKSVRYGVLELNTTYRGYLAWAPRIKYSKIHTQEIRYDVSDLLDTAYQTYGDGVLSSSVRRIGLLRYGVLYIMGTAYWVLGYGVLAESVLFLIFDQSIIYDVYTDVDMAYSSKSGNGLEFFKVFRYGVCF
nr:hypothetical protein [Tanacetum cinerariifolium]